MIKEVPMFSPNPRGVHYTRFVHDENLTLDDGTKIIQELNTYHAYDSFKWNFSPEGTPQQGDYQPLTGLVISDGYATIRTNSLKSFVKGDIVFLKWAGCSGRLFIITNASLGPYIYTPKPVLVYQILELKELL